MSEEGILDDNGNMQKLMYLDCLTIDSEDDIDSEFLKTFYNAVSYIDILALDSDKVLEALPPAEKMEKITELRVGSKFTSFKNANIHDNLKHLENLERIFVGTVVEHMSHSSLRQLANLNGEKSILFLVNEHVMARHVIEAITDDQSDVDKVVRLAYGDDRIIIDRKKKEITFTFGLSLKKIQEDLFDSVKGFNFSFQMVDLSQENKNGYLYKRYLQITKERVIQLRAIICPGNCTVTTTSEFDEITAFELASLMDALYVCNI